MTENKEVSGSVLNTPKKTNVLDVQTPVFTKTVRPNTQSLHLQFVDESLISCLPSSPWKDNLTEKKRDAESLISTRAMLFAKSDSYIPTVSKLANNFDALTQSSFSTSKEDDCKVKDLLPPPFHSQKSKRISFVSDEQWRSTNKLKVQINRAFQSRSIKRYQNQLNSDIRELIDDIDETKSVLESLNKLAPLIFRALRVCGNRNRVKQSRDYLSLRIKYYETRISLAESSVRFLQSIETAVQTILRNPNFKPEDFDPSVFNETSVLLYENTTLSEKIDILSSIYNELKNTNSRATNITNTAINLYTSGFSSHSNFQNSVIALQTNITDLQKSQTLIEILNYTLKVVKNLKLESKKKK